MTSNFLNNSNQLENAELLNRSRPSAFRFNEDRIYFYHNILNLDNELEIAKENLERVTTTKQLFENDWNAYNFYVGLLVNKNAVRVDYLQSLLDQYEVERESVYLTLEGQVDKVRRKISYINALTNNFSWVNKESFFNYQQIDTIVENILNVNTVAQECTLPIKRREQAYIKDLIIDIGSECIIGSPEGTNNKTSSLLATEEGTGFSVYSTNQSNCKLILDIEFNGSKIVNFLSIKKNKNAECFLKEITDIRLITAQGTSVSVKDISKSDLQFKAGKDTLEAFFLPVDTSSIKMIIDQKEVYYSNSIAYKQIDLDYISFFGVRFEDNGKLKSLPLNFDAYTSLIAAVDRYPEELNYNINLQINSGEESYSLELGEEPNLLDSSLNQLNWELNLTRDVVEKVVPTKSTTFTQYSLYAPRPFNVSEIETIDITEECVRSKIKVMHLIKGEIFNSAQRNVSIVDRKKFDNAVQVILFIDAGNPINLEEYGLANSAFVNTDENKCKIKYAECKPKVLTQGEYYWFETGPIFDFNSMKYIYEDVEYKDLEIWETSETVKGFAISKDKISFERKDYKLSSYGDQDSPANSYNFATPIIQGSLIFKDKLAEGFEEKAFIDGSTEFEGASSQIEDGLNSQNVAPGTIIAFELSEEPITGNNVELLKNGSFFASVILTTNVVTSELATDTPVIDTVSNVFYMKTSEESFFTNYSLKYKYVIPGSTVEKYFSVNYESGSIFFSHSVDETRRVSFETQGNQAVSRFTLAKYYDLSLDGTEIQVYDDEPVENLRLNMLHIYLPIVSETISLEDMEDYYSPILYSVELKAT